MPLCISAVPDRVQSTHAPYWHRLPPAKGNVPLTSEVSEVVNIAAPGVSLHLLRLNFSILRW